MLGYFGGTFDPVHNGHLHAARCAVAELRLARLHFVLAGQPSHRQTPIASAAQRWRMLQLALQCEGEALVADDRDMRQAAASYTVPMLRQIRDELGADTPLIWLLGWDAYCSLPSWHEWQRLAELAHVVVFQRPSDAQALSEPQPLDPKMEAFTRQRLVANAAALENMPAGAVYFLAAEMLPISATEVRLAIARGNSPADLLPPPVWTYIKEQHLYQHRGDPTP